MFTYYFVTVNPGPFEEVERALLEVLDALPGEANRAYREGEALRGQLRLDDRPVAKAVHMDIGAPVRAEGETFVPLTWEATGTPGLFPRMEAELVVSALGPEITHIGFRGSYRPPLGRLGRVLDRALLHRVAELTVKGFVDRLAAAVTERMGPHPEMSAIGEGS
jgi:hypothetical protein